MRRGLELAEERRPRRGSLDQEGIGQLGRRELLDLPQVRVAGEQDERASTRTLQDLDDFAPRRADKLRRPRIGHRLGQVENRLLREVELRGQPRFVRRADAQPAAHVVEAAVDAQRGGREDGRRHPIQQHLADDVRHVDRGRPQEHPAPADVEVVDVARIVRAREKPDVVAQLGGAASQRDHVFGDVLRQGNRGLDRFERPHEGRLVRGGAFEQRGLHSDAALAARAGLP